MLTSAIAKRKKTDISTDSKTTKDSSGTVASTTNPWAPQASALEKAFNSASSTFDATSANPALAPTDFTAQFTPEQLSTFRSMVAQGGDTSVADRQAAAGKSNVAAGSQGAQDALQGYTSFNGATTNNPASLVAAANQYADGQDTDAMVRNAMLGATQTARDVTLPGINQNAAISGNTNSSRTGIAEGLVARGLAQQSTDLGASLRSTAFANGLTLAQQQAQNNNTNRLAALEGQGALGNATTNTGISAGTSSVDNTAKQAALAVAGGAGLQSAEQAKLDNQSQQYASAVQSPYANVQALLAAIGGQNWGSSTTGTTTGTETSTKQPSVFEILGGALGAAGNATSLFAPSAPTINTDVGNGAGGHPVVSFR